MIDSLIFYNQAGKGDIHFSRGFCNYTQRLLKPTTCTYYHCFHPTSFRDICENASLKDMPDPRDTLVLDTWIGNAGKETISRYAPNGITYDIHFEIHRRFVADIFSFDIPSDPSIYFPRIDYRQFEIEKIGKVKHLLNKKNVLIDNCEPRSNQSQHFCFSSIVNRIATDYPDVNFFVLNSHPDIQPFPNVFFVENIFDGPTNLNEFSYLSLFCDTIIGRTSGPYMHTVVAENIQDKNKTFICFCRTEIESSYIEKSQLKANFIWKDTANTQEIYEVIKSEL